MSLVGVESESTALTRTIRRKEGFSSGPKCAGLSVQKGSVAFIPVAKSQDELRELISRDDPSFDLIPLGREYRKMVSDEFRKQSPSLRDHEDSIEETNEDSEDNDQQYHQHGL